MSIYYLKDDKKLLSLKGFTVPVEFETLHEAIDYAKEIAKENPNKEIEIIKTIGLITFIQTNVSEFEEIFFN
jgi:hypothetical protein